MLNNLVTHGDNWWLLIVINKTCNMQARKKRAADDVQNRCEHSALEVWRNDRYLRDCLVRVPSKDIARTRSQVQTADTATQSLLSASLFWIFALNVWHVILKHVCPGFRARSANQFDAYLGYRQMFQPKRHNSTPTIQNEMVPGRR